MTDNHEISRRRTNHQLLSRPVAAALICSLSCTGSNSFLLSPPTGDIKQRMFSTSSMLWATRPNGRNAVTRSKATRGRPTKTINRSNNRKMRNGKNNSVAKNPIRSDEVKNIDQPKRTQQAKSPQLFSRYEMLEHELLTAEEEKSLGEKVKRTIQLRAKINELVEYKHTEQQVDEESGRNVDFDDFNDYDVELEGEDFLSENEYNSDEIANLSMYGINDQALMERDRESMQSLAISSLVNNDEGDVNQEFGMISESLYDDGLCSSLVDGGLLSEEEVIYSLGVPGGRRELYSVLMDGALARDELIRSNIRLVVSIAKRWAQQSTKSNANEQSLSSIYNGSWDRPSLDEAIQEGIIGLATAADRFEPERNLKFGTYATYWITNSVRKCYQQGVTGCVRIPPNYHIIKQKYQKLVKAHYEEDGSFPKIEDIAEEMGVTKKRLEFVLRSTQPLISIDAPIHKDVGPRQSGKAGAVESQADNALLLTDTISCSEPQPEEQVEFSLLRQCLENAMAAELSPHERDILRLRLGLDDGVTRSIREVVELCGGTLTVSDVRMAEVRAFRKLRSPYASHTYQLLGYLDTLGIDVETSKTNGKGKRKLR